MSRVPDRVHPRFGHVPIKLLATGARTRNVEPAPQDSMFVNDWLREATHPATVLPSRVLVNTIGAYTGTSVYGFTEFSKGVTLQLSADAAWTITISPVSAAPALPTSGAGDGVFLYTGAVGQLAATHDGSANFVVSEQTGNGPEMSLLLINTIGAYSGTVPISAGPVVFSITADGHWTAQTK